MRLLIENDKNTLLQFVFNYLSQTLDGKYADVIINGKKTSGTIGSLELEEDQDRFLTISVDGETIVIPLLDETKSMFGKELFQFETKNHTTIIEVKKKK